MGVEHILDPDAPEWREQLLEITGGRGADAGAECSGIAYYRERVPAGLGIDGRLHLTGHTPDTRMELHVLEDVLNRPIMITGSHDERICDRRAMVRMLRDPQLQRNIDVMVTHEFPMSRAAEALEISLWRDCGKIHLLPQE